MKKYAIIASALFGLIMTCGCAAKRDVNCMGIDSTSVFDASNAPLRQFAWVRQYAQQLRTSSLITVDSTYGSTEGTVFERYWIGDAVVCDELLYRDETIQRSRMYEFTDLPACETLDSLMHLASTCKHFVLPGYARNALPPFVSCIIVVRESPHFVYIEGGVNTTEFAFQLLRHWREKKSMDEPIHDGDLAVGLLGAGAFADCAIFLDMAVDAFDGICEIGCEAQRTRNCPSMQSNTSTP